MVLRGREAWRGGFWPRRGFVLPQKSLPLPPGACTGVFSPPWPPHKPHPEKPSEPKCGPAAQNEGIVWPEVAIKHGGSTEGGLAQGLHMSVGVGMGKLLRVHRQPASYRLRFRTKPLFFEDDRFVPILCTHCVRCMSMVTPPASLVYGELFGPCGSCIIPLICNLALWG